MKIQTNILVKTLYGLVSHLRHFVSLDRRQLRKLRNPKNENHETEKKYQYVLLAFTQLLE